MGEGAVEASSCKPFAVEEISANSVKNHVLATSDSMVISVANFVRLLRKYGAS
jgi:hypothetical protein